MTVEELIRDLQKNENKQLQVIMDGYYGTSQVLIDKEKGVVNII